MCVLCMGSCGVCGCSDGVCVYVHVFASVLKSVHSRFVVIRLAIFSEDTYEDFYRQISELEKSELLPVYCKVVVKHIFANVD